MTWVSGNLQAAAQDEVQLPQITVTGAQATSTMQPADAFPGGQVAAQVRTGFLGTESVFDAPYSITSYTNETIENDQATSVSEVVEHDPSVRAGYPRASYEDPLQVRGFGLYAADFAIEGLYGLASGYGEQLNGIDRIELIKGPNSFLTGVPPSNSIGGAINLVPKRATPAPVTDLTAYYSSDEHVGASVDVGRRFGADQAFGLRFNANLETGEIAYESSDLDAQAASLAFDYTRGPLRWTVDLFYDATDADALQTGSLLAPDLAVPDAPPNSQNFYQPWEFATNNNSVAMTRVEYDLNADWTLFGAVGARYYSNEFIYDFPTIVNAAGYADGFAGYFNSWRRGQSGEIGLRGTLTTGPVRHQISLAASGIRQDTGNVYVGLQPTFSNIYDPFSQPAPDIDGFDDLGRPKSSDMRQTSFALGDTLWMLGDRLALTIGGRQQRIETRGFDRATGAVTADYDDARFSPALAILGKPTERISLYANYMEGLSEGPVAPVGTVNEGEVFAPFVAEQVEVGAKWDGGDLGVTVAYFDINQPSGVVDPVSNVFSVDGEQRHRGFELFTFGEPWAGVRIIGGAMILKSELSGTAGGVDDGNEAIGVPGVQANAGVEYDLPSAPGLTLTGDFTYTGSQYVDSANLQEVPEWTKFDVGARYTFERRAGDPIVVRASVQNVFGEDYWQAAQDGYLTQGEPRTLLVSTSFSF